MGMGKREVLTCDLLLQEFHVKQVPVLDRKKLTFSEVDGKDVYNITAPFEDEGEQVVAGRVESRDSEQSEVLFFTEKEGVWVPRRDRPVLNMQDPFVSKIGDEVVVGGVQTFPDPVHQDRLLWRTVLYRGRCLRELRHFFVGPDGMKDIRLVELKNGEIGVFTRPQGAKGGRGKIGFFRVSSLEELRVDLILDAPLLEEQFADGEWGGVNEARMLSNGLVGVLGHIARFDEEGNRHYYPMVFAFDPESGKYSDIELIAVRANFEPGPAKREDLKDVVFSGGLVRFEDGNAALYAGISDAEAHYIIIPDPFLAYEGVNRRKKKKDGN
ncbi:hypothetical protein J25TS5_43750 [Paenibacillus faecis]|uniref:MTP-1 family protein n=1 Tax=Paenibacillus faecis TaxID=862114 RepID=UPI001B0C8C99|nr:DUF1861 family protein [Paenibacillus faecis]GIO87443.1 hypothetical protein J25TS5_43750 [Paenibacillus faecis]